MNILGLRIKDGRKSKGLSQNELGDLLGIRNTQISNYEKGTSVPPSDTLSMLADIFGCTTDYLLGRTNDKSVFVTEVNIDGNIIRVTSTRKLSEKEILKLIPALTKEE